MKIGSKFIAVTATIFLVTALIPSAHSASSLQNKSCPKLKSTKSSSGITFICKSVAGKKVWAVAAKSNLKVPIAAPSFTLVYSPTGSNSKTPAVLIGIYGFSDEQIKNESITGFYVSARSDGAWTTPYFMTIDKSDLVVQGKKVWASNYEISSNTLGKDVSVRVQTVTTRGVSNWSAPQLVSTQLTDSLPAPTSNPTTSATPGVTTTPAPITPPSPQAEIGCSVNYLSPLPYASQRIAITNIVWEKDSLGYVSGLATLRNDNSMSLRLVEFTFYLMHKGLVINTESTLQGNHFFIQDDAKFNSVDRTSGPWLSGQARTFRIPTNQILECRSITITSSGFSVKQGIGAS